MPTLSRTTDYADRVAAGDIVAGELVSLACQRHISDLDRDFDYIFSDELAEKAIRFIEKLPHTKGRWAAKRELITLEPWQCFIVGSLFGWVNKNTGLRRYTEAYIEIARKNGKSVLAAAIGLYMLVADGEFGAEVYSGATTEKQAWEVFRPARLMAKKTPDLLEYYDLEVNASNLLRMEDFSKFEPLIGNPGDGSNPHCAIVDEYHEHKSADLYETMVTGMAAREQPMLLAITTAGDNLGGPCYEKRAEGIKVVRGVFEDERMFVLIYTIDDEDDWKDPDVWMKSNPNLGVSVSPDFLESQVGKAKRNPGKQASLKTKHFNKWLGARQAWINMEQWGDCADPDLKIEDYADCDGVLSLDMATRVDIAARVSLLWKEVDGVKHYAAFPHFYLPEGALESLKNGSTYRGWAEGEYIQLMDGEETSYNDVQTDILGMRAVHSVMEFTYDPWQTTQMAQNLREEGVLAVEFRNTTANMSPAMRELEGALASGRFKHPDNPVLNWMASNVVAKEDANQNIFPRKELKESKIDGIVALIMAVGRAMYAQKHGTLQDFLDNAI